MLDVYFFIDLVASIALFILAAIVLIRNNKTEVNKAFGLFTLLVAGWILANYYSNDNSMPRGVVLFANQATLFLSYLSLVVLNLFLMTLNTNPLSKFKQPLTIILALVSLTALTPYVVGAAHFEGDVSVIDFGLLTPVYFFGFGLTAGLIFYSLAKGMSELKGVERQRIKVIFNGALITIGISICTNAILPAVFDIYELVNIGPVSTLALIFALYYAITKHQLFNIRLVVARALGYVLSLGVLISIYVFVLFIATQKIFEGTDPIIKDQVVPLAAAVVLGLSYPKFKLFFDRLTNKIFYRDSYDPQAFLDELNSTIVKNIELGILLRHSAAVIQQNLKCEYCFIEVLAATIEGNRVMGVGNLELGRNEDKIIFDSVAKMERKTLVADQVTSDQEKLKDVLTSKNIGVISRLVPGSEPGSRAIAHLIIGQKKSGNVYDKQDIRIVEIISDELLIAIQNALRFEEIQEFNVTLQAKVNEATAKLKRTNDKLKDLDEAKDEFISMASHQLRTPLTSVKGYLSMVMEGDAGKISQPQKELLTQAFTSSQRMVYLIADLLNVSRLKTGKFVINNTQSDLVDIVETEISQLRETLKAKKITLEFKKPDNISLLMLDDTKIRQVIMNFIDNAIYYTPADGHISVEVKEDKNNVYFIVKDTGLGIPREEQKHLFTKFYRASNARKVRPDGTGLGLFMAKRVIAAQGGSILFESTEGKGSTFGFTFSKASLGIKQD